VPACKFEVGRIVAFEVVADVNEWHAVTFAVLDGVVVAQISFFLPYYAILILVNHWDSIILQRCHKSGRGHDNSDLDAGGRTTTFSLASAGLSHFS
jgi:hypothetical protein